MTTGFYNESDYENAVLEVLRAMKWEYMYDPDVERDYRDPTLPDVFECQVRKLNKGVPDEAVNDTTRLVHLWLFPHFDELPAIRWKRRNLESLRKSNPAKFTAQREALERLFEKEA